uniref:Glycosyltransferase 2-like domain-containing protein n=1 Tax=Haptolina ericina TaxID=156174 RepID=A0A7S3AML5_9EUKA
MHYHKCSCVQGSTYLRQRFSIFDNYINSEFFVTHFVFFPAMQFLTGCAVFGGSNALWRVDDLRGSGFRDDVQTEDIELSTRAMMSRLKIRFCPEARSGELPPSTLMSLYRQRLRWALGWDQVTIQHFRGIGSANLSCREKTAMYWILPMRWAILSSATINALVSPVVAYVYQEQLGGSLGLPIDSCIALAATSFVVVSTIVLASAIMHESPWRWPAVVIFQASGILYVSLQLLLALISLAKICIGADGGWIVTARATGTSSSAPSKAKGPGAVQLQLVHAEDRSTSGSDPSAEYKLLLDA